MAAARTRWALRATWRSAARLTRSSVPGRRGRTGREHPARRSHRRAAHQGQRGHRQDPQGQRQDRRGHLQDRQGRRGHRPGRRLRGHRARRLLARQGHHVQGRRLRGRVTRPAGLTARPTDAARCPGRAGPTGAGRRGRVGGGTPGPGAPPGPGMTAGPGMTGGRPVGREAIRGVAPDPPEVGGSTTRATSMVSEELVIGGRMAVSSADAGGRAPGRGPPNGSPVPPNRSPVLPNRPPEVAGRGAGAGVGAPETRGSPRELVPRGRVAAHARRRRRTGLTEPGRARRRGGVGARVLARVAGASAQPTAAGAT
ncbi:hypothetical protein ACFQX7_28745 [Luedemannella flava]